jgi:hypothetical protein
VSAPRRRNARVAHEVHADQPRREEKSDAMMDPRRRQLLARPQAAAHEEEIMQASKRTTCFPALALSAAFAALGFASRAHAADATPEDRMPSSYAAMMKMKPMDAMQMVNGGEKGPIAKEQYMKFHEKMFERMDRNHDGRISEQEWAGKASGE